jgi:Zn-dependent protease
MLQKALPLPFPTRELESVRSLERGIFRRLVALGDHPFLAVALSVLGFAFLGPIAAVLVVATMLDHEFAHRFMMRKLGYNPGPVRMVPFIGAFVKAGRPLLRSSDIALIYLAGPLAGVLSAALAVLVSVPLLQPALLHQIYVGAAVAVALNLFNLLPLEPLDGGLVSRALPYQCLVLFPALIGVGLAVERQFLLPFGLPLFLVACWLTAGKFLKWRRYLAALRAREEAGDLYAVREVRASLDVPLLERVLVVIGYGILITGASGLLLLFAQGAHWMA